MQTEPLTPIGRAAARHGISTRAIRFYEERHLIRTQRNAKGHRCLDGVNMARITTIIQAQRCGFTLLEIAQLLGRGPSQTALRLDTAQFTAQMAALAEQQAAISRQMAELQRVFQREPSGASSVAA